MIREDPDGYLLEHDNDDWLVTRRSDSTTIGTYPTRDEALAAAEADRLR